MDISTEQVFLNYLFTKNEEITRLRQQVESASAEINRLAAEGTDLKALNNKLQCELSGLLIARNDVFRASASVEPPGDLDEEEHY